MSWKRRGKKVITKQKKGGPVTWADARLSRKRKKHKKRKPLTELEKLQKGIGCARGSNLRIIEEK